MNTLYVPKKCVHGFIRGKNTQTNAKSHLGNKNLLKLDIKNFFESIDTQSVFKAFKYLGFDDNISTILSKISTLDNKLVQGFSTSPTLANIVFSKLDKKINSLCLSNNATYTRYADDISISTNLNYPSIKEIERILNSNGFKLNHSKTRKFKYGQNQYVTGLSIADKSYPRIPKHIKKKLRQELYYLNLYGYHSHICYINGWDEATSTILTDTKAHKLRNRIKGWIDYIHSIEPNLANQLYIKLSVSQIGCHI